MAVVLIALLVCYGAGLAVRLLQLPGFLLLFALIGTEVTWNLTGYDQGGELGRLFMPVAVAARVAVILIVAFAADAFLQRRWSSSLSSAATRGAHTW